MGTSFTEYGGFGFWAKDTAVEIWIALMVWQFDQQPTLTEPQRALRDDFTFQATFGGIGCINPGLDAHLCNELRPWLIEASKAALADLEKQGHLLQPDWVNPLFKMRGSLMESDYCWGNGLPSDFCLHYARLWIALVTGDFELQETAWIGDIHRAGIQCFPKPR